MELCGPSSEKQIKRGVGLAWVALAVGEQLHLPTAASTCPAGAGAGVGAGPGALAAQDTVRPFHCPRAASPLHQTQEERETGKQGGPLPTALRAWQLGSQMVWCFRDGPCFLEGEGVHSPYSE